VRRAAPALAAVVACLAVLLAARWVALVVQDRGGSTGARLAEPAAGVRA
jgi:hypothetical protein